MVGCRHLAFVLDHIMDRLTIAVAADHAGFELKEFLKQSLLSSGHEVLDLG